MQYVVNQAAIGQNSGLSNLDRYVVNPAAFTQNSGWLKNMNLEYACAVTFGLGINLVMFRYNSHEEIVYGWGEGWPSHSRWMIPGTWKDTV